MVRWFNLFYVQKIVAHGQRLVVYGKPKARGKDIVIDHPEFEILEPEADDEEETLKVLFRAKPGQLVWRRQAIRTQFDGDLDGFHQEFPSTPSEAFITSGRQYFGAQHIMRFRPVDPIRRGRIQGIWRKKAEVKIVKDDRGPLWIYEPRQPDTRYVLFIDPAGVVGDARARHFGSADDPSDYTCMWIVNCKTMDTAAVWHGRSDLGLIGEEAAKLGRIYNNAIICPEVTGGSGFAIVMKLRDIGYPALHRDRERKTYARARSEMYGWMTSVSTRPIMLETLRDVLRETPDKLKHAPLREEMTQFIIVKNKPEATPGTHDDQVMAAAGAYTIAAEYAQRRPLKTAVLRKPGKASGFTDVLSRARHN